MRAVSTDEAFGHRFRTRVLIPVLSVFLSVTLLGVFGLHRISSESDAISIERQSREADRAITNILNELARTQKGAAVWDELVVRLRRPEVNSSWLDENLGTWLWRFFHHDEVYVLNARGTPVYAMAEGKSRAPASYSAITPDLRGLVDRARARARAIGATPAGPIANAPDSGDDARMDGRIVSAADLLTVRGRPAAVSITRVIPFSDKVRLLPGQEDLLISIRFLDKSFLEALSHANLIAAPRFARSPEVAADELAMPVMSSTGSRLGYFIWRPELPGSALWRATAPLGLLDLTVLGLVMATLAYRVRRLMRREDRTIRELRTAQVELKASEAQAHHLAFHDSLTGLPNRALFNTCIEQALVRARGKEAFAILLLDLDRFKQVNDTLGHLAGDALIQEFARRLEGIVEAGETVARLGGDEFAILAVNSVSKARVEALAGRILEEVRRPFEVLGNRVHVGVSIGIAMAPECGLDRTDLMRKADIALYRAKEQDGDCHRLFTANMDEAVKLRASLEEDLRAALASGEGLEVHYQPQVDSTGKSVVGLEALARWRHPTRGFISPQMFVSIAEETGLILDLGDWVLREACRVASQWPALSMAVNLSPVQFRTQGFVQRVRAIVEAAGVEPGQIELEITEGLLIHDDQAVLDSLRKLRSMGFRIALDDFGTGYSSLSYLRKFEVDKIKIDRSFVQNLGQALDSSAIITAVVTLGHAMGLSVTAEGVETAEQGSLLSEIGCNELQGHLYARALPESQLTGLLAGGQDIRSPARRRRGPRRAPATA